MKTTPPQSDCPLCRFGCEIKVHVPLADGTGYLEMKKSSYDVMVAEITKKLGKAPREIRVSRKA